MVWGVDWILVLSSSLCVVTLVGSEGEKDGEIRGPHRACSCNGRRKVMGPFVGLSGSRVTLWWDVDMEERAKRVCQTMKTSQQKKLVKGWGCLSGSIG